MDASSLDGGGEFGVGLADLAVGVGDPGEDVDWVLGRQAPADGGFADGGASCVAVGAERYGSVGDDRGELAVRTVVGLVGVEAADGSRTKVSTPASDRTLSAQPWRGHIGSESP